MQKPEQQTSYDISPSEQSPDPNPMQLEQKPIDETIQSQIENQSIKTNLIRTPQQSLYSDQSKTADATNQSNSRSTVEKKDKKQMSMTKKKGENVVEMRMRLKEGITENQILRDRVVELQALLMEAENTIMELTREIKGPKAIRRRYSL